MKTLGILEKIKQYPDTFFPLLCHKPIKLTADILDGLFHITFSIDGSNRKFVESRVVAFWRDYLQDAEGKSHIWFKFFFYLAGGLALKIA